MKPIALSYYWKKKTILSFFAVVFVVFIHSSATHQYNVTPDTFTGIADFLRNFLAYNLGSFAVPFFFFISGVTLFRNFSMKEYKNKLSRRVKTLLVPYLIWNIIGLLFAIIYTYTPLNNYISGRELFTPSINNIFDGIFLYKYNFHFWFLFDLIIFTLLAPVFNLLIFKKWLACISGIALLLLPLITDSFLHINTYSIIFYFLGCYIGKYHLSFFSKPHHKTFSFFSLVITLILLIIQTLPFYQIITIPPIISQIILLTLLLSIWFSSDLIIPKINQPKFATEFFPVYTIHVYFIAIITKIIVILFPQTSFMMLINELTAPIITIIITTIISYSWHQKLPKSYNFFFGRATRN